MAEQGTADGDGDLPKKYSCVLCHRRKVKCDREHPCGYCARHNDECVYEAPPPPKRRKKEPKSEHADLLARLQRAEDQLRRVVPAETFGSPSTSASQPPRNATASNRPVVNQSQPSADTRKFSNTSGRLIAQGGQSRYLDNNLWVHIDDEIQNPQSLLAENDRGRGGEDYDNDGDAEDGSDMLLGITKLGDNELYMMFPTPAQQEILWQAYVDNIHYLCMILHRPSFQKTVDQARDKGIATLSKAKVALLYSTYFMAAASLNNAQCETKLGQPRRVILRTLRAGTRHALVKAAFIRSTDMICLQAFTQFLLCMRSGMDSQTLWVLSGAAFRIAQRMGVHREDAEAHLPVFECEMRRRVWRQLLIIDFTTAELAGCAPGYAVQLGLESNSRMPLNVNDDDLYESMTELPPERYGATDMIFCRLRYEFHYVFLYKTQSQFAFDTTFRQVQDTEATKAEKDQRINELESKLQTQFLRFCDPVNRLHTLTSVAARSAVIGMRLRNHHPRQHNDSGQAQSQEERNLCFDLSLKIMQYDNFCHSQPELQGYLWHVRVYFVWHGFIFLLNELRTRVTGEEADKSWEVIEQVFHHHPELVSGSNFALYRAIRSICLRAWAAREAALRHRGQFVTIPSFVNRLREQLGIHPDSSTAPLQQPTPSDSGALTTDMYNGMGSMPTQNMYSDLTGRGQQPMVPFQVDWQQQQPTQQGEIDGLKVGEPSPIDWEAWDSLVQMDLPTLEYGLEAFFQ